MPSRRGRGVFKIIRELTFTADAILKKSDNDKTFTADAILVTGRDIGGILPRKIVRRYEFDVAAEIIKKGIEEIRIYSPLIIRKDKEFAINLSVFKKIEEDLDIIMKMDNRKLWETLDAI